MLLPVSHFRLMIRLRGERVPILRDKCHSRYAPYTLLHIPPFRVYAKERKKKATTTHMGAMYGEGGGETGERILFSLESRFLLRVRIRRRKEEENAPIRNERRMFLPSLVSHSLPRIDAQGTHHRLPKKKTVGNATTRALPCFPEKKT